MQRSRSEAVGREIAGRTAMTTAMHPEGALRAARVLESGGSAHDAAVAALAAMAVAEPFMSGPGGHGAAVVAEPGRPPYVVDGSARGPRAAPAGEPPLRGGGAIPVPAALAGWTGLHRAGGTRPLAELLAPAAAAAREGVPAAWYTALMIAANAPLLRRDAAAAAIFLDADGLPPRPEVSLRAPADRIVQRDLAATLERIGAHGLDELRSGETGERIVAAVRRAGGHLDAADLEALEPASPEAPVEGRFRGWTVHAGPVASAAPSLLEMLAIVEDLDPDATPLGSARYYARLADAQRAAFLDRDRHGDPRFVDPPLGAYGDPELARLRREDFAAAGAGGPLPRRDLDRAGYPVAADVPVRRPGEGASTTHVNVAAPNGALIAATFTLGFPFGSGLVADGTGLLLGNTLHQFHPDPAHPNGVAPAKRAVWNGAPAILSRDGVPRVAVGAPGGVRIPGAILQVLVAHLVYGLSPQRATEVPRIFQQHDVAYVDDRVPAETIDALRAEGRTIEPVREGPFASHFARPSLVSIDGDGVRHGGVDAWRLGTVVGL